MSTFEFPPPPLAPEAEALRAEVRDFLAVELATRSPGKRAESWNGFDRDFSRKLGARGWIGMMWPKQYGGHERTALERYVVLEELLAAGAPVLAHWIADRQMGPLILRLGTEEQRQTILPQIAAGEITFCIGMSEPDAGSDLAAVRTKAVREENGWRVNGTKLWTTMAHHAKYMILFCRTDSLDGDNRHGGTSQMLVDLSLPGITIRAIPDLAGHRHFNEVVFENALLPPDALIGKQGDGWNQVTAELALERSGPERFLSSIQAVIELIRIVGRDPSERAAIAVGRLAAHLMTLRRMSRSIAGMLQNGQNPTLQASIVKDLGAVLEQEIPEIARLFIDEARDDEAARDFHEVLAYTAMHAPSFSLRGGTREILRGIIARGMGLR